MKSVKIVGSGILIWGMGLLWPEINQLLTAEIMAAIALVLGTVILGQLWLKRFWSEPSVGPELPKRDYLPRTPGDSRPIKPLGLV